MALEQSTPPHKRPKLDHEDGDTAETDVASHRTTEKDAAISEKDVATPKKHINDLPMELLARVLGFLPRYDLVRNASAVCWRWHEAAFDQDNWRTIDVCVGDKMSVQDLGRLVKDSTKILRIRFDEIRFLETFENVLRKSSSLKVLALNVKRSQHDSSDTASIMNIFCCRVRSRGALTSIGQHCVKLQELELHQVDGLTDEILTAILKSCKDLGKLTVSRCNLLTRGILSMIGNNASQLKELDVGFADNERIQLHNHCIEQLVAGCPMLRTLEIYAHTSYRTDWRRISELKYLRKLTIACTAVDWLIDDKVIIPWITECENLQFLAVFSQDLGEESLKVIASSRLADLNMLISHEITDQGLEFLTTSTTLRRILLIANQDLISVTGHGIIKLARALTKVERLSVMVSHDQHPLFMQMQELSSIWKGVYPISVNPVERCEPVSVENLNHSHEKS